MFATALVRVALILVFQYSSMIFSGSTITPMGGPILGHYLYVDSIPNDIFSTELLLLTGIYVYIVFKQRWRERTKTGPRRIIHGAKHDEKSDMDSFTKARRGRTD